MATAARVKYPAALQRCKFDTPLLAAGALIASGYAGRFGEGDYTLIAGKSGVELARMTMEKTLKDMVAVKPEYMAEKSLLIKKGWRRK